MEIVENSYLYKKFYFIGLVADSRLTCTGESSFIFLIFVWKINSSQEIYGEFPNKEINMAIWSVPGSGRKTTVPFSGNETSFSCALFSVKADPDVQWRGSEWMRTWKAFTTCFRNGPDTGWNSLNASYPAVLRHFLKTPLHRLRQWATFPCLNRAGTSVAVLTFPYRT